MFAICKDLSREDTRRKCVDVTQLCVLNLKGMTYHPFNPSKIDDVNVDLDYGRIVDGFMIRYKVLRIASSFDEAADLIKRERISLPHYERTGNEKLPITHFLLKMEKADAFIKKKKKSAAAKPSSGAGNVGNFNSDLADTIRQSLDNHLAQNTELADAEATGAVVGNCGIDLDKTIQQNLDNEHDKNNEVSRASKRVAEESIPIDKRQKLMEPQLSQLNQVHSDVDPDQDSNSFEDQHGENLDKTFTFSNFVTDASTQTQLEEQSVSTQTEDCTIEKRLANIEKLLETLVKNQKKKESNFSVTSENIHCVDDDVTGASPEDQQTSEEKFVNCGNGIKISKTDIRESILHEKNLITVVTRLLQLQYPKTLQLYFLSPTEQQLKDGNKKLPDVTVTSLKNIIRSFFTNVAQAKLDEKIDQYTKYAESRKVNQEDYDKGCQALRDKVIRGYPILDFTDKELRVAISHALYNYRASLDDEKKKAKSDKKANKSKTKESAVENAAQTSKT